MVSKAAFVALQALPVHPLTSLRSDAAATEVILRPQVRANHLPQFTQAFHWASKLNYESLEKINARM